MADETYTFKTCFERRSGSDILEDRIRGRDAGQLMRDLAFQCETYSLDLAQQESNRRSFPGLGISYSDRLDVHDVSKKSLYFRKALSRLERLGRDSITMAELREADPPLYYRFCYELHTAINNDKKPFRFLKF